MLLLAFPLEGWLILTMEDAHGPLFLLFPFLLSCPGALGVVPLEIQNGDKRAISQLHCHSGELALGQSAGYREGDTFVGQKYTWHVKISSHEEIT